MAEEAMKNGAEVDFGQVDLDVEFPLRGEDLEVDAGVEVPAADDNDIWVENILLKDKGRVTRSTRAVKSAVPGDAVLILREGSEQWTPAKFVVNLIDDDKEVEVELEDGTRLTLEKHQVATAGPPEDDIGVGDRVLFENRHEDASDDDAPSDAPNFVAGWIAEMPAAKNLHRYLVFVEHAGTAAYCTREQLRLTFGFPKSLSLTFRSSFFAFLRQGPERLLLSLKVGDEIRVACLGNKYVKARVEKVDASIALFVLEEAKTKEWIYRGAKRLKPIRDECARRQRAKRPPPAAVVVKTEGGDDEEEPAGTEAKVPRTQQRVVVRTARKSTGGRVGVDSCHRPAAAQRIRELAECVGWEYSSKEDDGMLVVRKWRMLGAKRPKDGEATSPDHVCTRECSRATFKPHLEPYFEYIRKNLQPGLLDWPILFEYSRHLVQTTRGKGKARGGKLACVQYVAPCWKVLASCEAVVDHLIRAESFLSIDMFSFEVDVDIGFEFIADEHLKNSNELEKSLSSVELEYAFTWLDKEGNKKVVVKDPRKDLSEGKEALAIYWVDAFGTKSTPGLVSYLCGIESRGIDMNKRKGFRSCCDCTDGCLAWKKCACRRLTNEIAKNPGAKRTWDYTYSFRRLSKKVPTGIFECNADCACAKNPQHCTNRAVSDQVSVKLELFMTNPAAHKGWGVRALQDIPKGTFICSYAGELMRHNEAEKEGMTYNDRYFLDLDYISTGERLKEGYEESISIPSEDDDVPKSESYKIANHLGDELVMDSLRSGNIGRFFNHSCDPNLFVQNVFVETHDPRFPVVTLFTSRNVKAGEELCWSYGYDAVKEGEDCSDIIVLECRCGAKFCSGKFKLGLAKTTGPARCA